MVYNVSRKDLEVLLENRQYSKLFEIFSACSTPEEVNTLKIFIKNNGFSLNHSDMVKFVTHEMISQIREHNRLELEKQFVPMKKRMSNNSNKTSDENKYIIDNYKDKISLDSYIALRQIYNTDKENYTIGLYNIQYTVDNSLENGILFGNNAKFSERIKEINNLDYMINQISNCNEERQSYGSIIVKVPKAALDKKSIPIYYQRDNLLYLNPEYVICYVPVKDKKILGVEINNSMNDVESTIYEGDRLKQDKTIIRR